MSSKKLIQGPTESRTRVAGFKVQSAKPLHHRTWLSKETRDWL